MATPPSPPQVLAVTTAGVEGYRIARYLGIVSGEAILDTGLGAEVVAGTQELTGGRATEWEREVQRARFTALSAMSQRAQAWGANAVVGVCLDTEAMGMQGSILLVTATGTAVVVEPIPR